MANNTINNITITNTGAGYTALPIVDLSMFDVPNVTNAHIDPYLTALEHCLSSAETMSQEDFIKHVKEQIEERTTNRVVSALLEGIDN